MCRLIILDSDIDKVANQSAREHITTTLRIDDTFGDVIVELAVRDYNKGGSGTFVSGWVPITRRERKALKEHSARQIEVAIRTKLATHKRLMGVSVQTWTSLFLEKPQYYRVAARII